MKRGMTVLYRYTGDRHKWPICDDSEHYLTSLQVSNVRPCRGRGREPGLGARARSVYEGMGGTYMAVLVRVGQENRRYYVVNSDDSVQ